MSNGKDIRKAQKAIKAGKPFVDPYKQDVLYTNMGQWMYPGQVTKIPSNQITMEGVNYPVKGIDDTGYSQMMYPGMDYTFPGQYVTEYPQMQTAQYGGWLDEYGDGGDFNDYKRPGPVEDRSTGMTGMMKSKIATEAHYGNPSALRMVSPNPNKYTWTGEELDFNGNQASPAGYTGTHYMGSYGNQARPGLQEVNGKMQYFQNPQYNSKENFNFSRPEDAEYFANYYKEVAPMMRNYENGGLLDTYQDGAEKRKIPQSGIVVDKRTNIGYAMGDDGKTRTFNVLTGQVVDLNKDYSYDQVAKNPKLRGTPAGYYLLQKELTKIKGDNDDKHYKNKIRYLKPISAFGEKVNSSSDLAFHRLYSDNAYDSNDKEFNRRKALLNQSDANKRCASWGCTNVDDYTYDNVNKMFPKQDTLMVIDSKRPKDLALLNQTKKRMKPSIDQDPSLAVGYKKMGGWLDDYQVGGLKSVTGPAPKFDAKTEAESKRIASGYNNANKQNAQISQTRNWSQADQDHSNMVKARINNPASDLGILGANMASNITRFRNLTPEEIARTTDNPGETINLSLEMVKAGLINELVGYGASKAIPFIFKYGKKLLDASKINKFKSEVDWSKWNKEIPKNTKLIKEYHAIEKTSKANNTWMKNSDGSVFEGTPEQFVQQNSSNFKKAFPEGFHNVYRGSQSFDPTLSSSLSGNKNNHVLFGSSDRSVAESYATNGGYNLNHIFKDKGKRPNFFHPETSKPSVYTGAAEDVNPGMYNYAITKKTPQIKADGMGEMWYNAKNDDVLNWINQNKKKTKNRLDMNKFDSNWNPDRVSTDDVAEYMNEKNIPTGVVHNTLDANLRPAPISNVFMSNPRLTKIKSLVYNNGMFDMTNPNIYKSALPIGLGLGATYKMMKPSSQLEQNKYGGWLDNLDTYQTAGQVINRQDNTRVVIPNLPKDVFNDKNSFEKDWLSDAYEEDENVKLLKKQLAKDYQKNGLSKDQAKILAEDAYRNVKHNKSLKKSIPESTFEQHVPQDLTSKTLEVLSNPLLAMKQYKGHRLPDHFSSADEDFMSPVNISNLGYQFLTRPGQLAFSSESGNKAIDNIKEGEYLQAGLNAAFALPGVKVIKDAIKYKNKLGRVANIKEIRKVSNYLNKEGALENQGINELDQQYANKLEQEHQYQQYLNQENSLENQAINELDQTYIPITNTRQLKSTIKGSPLEKQLSKTGDISVNNIKAYINKAEVGQQDKFMIDKILNEKFAGKTKINYNDFKNALSEKIIPLERNVAEDAFSNYGVGKLGYPNPSKKSFDAAINHQKTEINILQSRLNKLESKPMHPMHQTKDRLKLQLDEAIETYNKTLAEYKQLPLENKSITYSNAKEFGKGSGDHFDETTLGHGRTLVSPEEPDIMHMLEEQSDFFQKKGQGKTLLEKMRGDKTNSTLLYEQERIARAKLRLEESKKYLNDIEFKQKNNILHNGNLVHDYEVQMAQNMLNTEKRALALRENNIKNWEQKDFLGKNHPERLLQENMIYAAEQGKSKMRYPTSETAAKIQGYTPKEILQDESVLKELHEMGLDYSDFKASDKNGILSDINYIENHLNKYPDLNLDKLKKIKHKVENNVSIFSTDFEPGHKTILKKYNDTPKRIKKLLGIDVRTVKDPKGNTWYEFDIPESINKGYFEMKAFSLGGLQDLDQEKLGGQRKLKKATSKNIQSSINDLMLRSDLMQRNQTLFGPAGKRRYKPGLKYKQGGWLDQFDK